MGFFSVPCSLVPSSMGDNDWACADTYVISVALLPCTNGSRCRQQFQVTGWKMLLGLPLPFIVHPRTLGCMMRHYDRLNLFLTLLRAFHSHRQERRPMSGPYNVPVEIIKLMTSAMNTLNTERRLYIITHLRLDCRIAK